MHNPGNNVVYHKLLLTVIVVSELVLFANSQYNNYWGRDSYPDPRCRTYCVPNCGTPDSTLEMLKEWGTAAAARRSCQQMQSLCRCPGGSTTTTTRRTTTTTAPTTTTIRLRPPTIGQSHVQSSSGSRSRSSNDSNGSSTLAYFYIIIGMVCAGSIYVVCRLSKSRHGSEAPRIGQDYDTNHSNSNAADHEGISGTTSALPTLNPRRPTTYSSTFISIARQEPASSDFTPSAPIFPRQESLPEYDPPPPYSATIEQELLQKIS